jgi:periplasmic protein TonB
MSLIPLVLSRAAAARANPEPAGPARYSPGGGYRPIAGVIAVGLPAALLVAVALSPFALPPVTEPDDTTIVNLPAPVPPPPPPKPDDIVPKPDKSLITAPPSPFPPIGPSPIDPVVDPLPTPTDPVIGQDPPTVIESVPAVPPLITAKLDPRYAGTFQPDYPPYEQRNEIEGTARVRVLVGTDGRVKAVEDATTTSPGFFAETKRRALSKWRFKPAMRGDTAEESWVTITVRFELNS